MIESPEYGGNALAAKMEAWVVLEALGRASGGIWVGPREGPKLKKTRKSELVTPWEPDGQPKLDQKVTWRNF